MDLDEYCVSTDVGTRTNWLTFKPDPDYKPDAGTGLLSPISFKRCYAEFYVGKIRHVRIGRCSEATRRGFNTDTVLRPTAAARCDFNTVLFSELSKHLCRRYMRSTECPSFYRAMRCISAPMPSCGVCVSVCLSRSWVASKRIQISSNFFTIG